MNIKGVLEDKKTKGTGEYYSFMETKRKTLFIFLREIKTLLMNHINLSYGGLKFRRNIIITHLPSISFWSKHKYMLEKLCTIYNWKGFLFYICRY